MKIFGIAIHGLAFAAWMFPIIWLVLWGVCASEEPKGPGIIDVIGGFIGALVIIFCLICLINAGYAAL